MDAIFAFSCLVAPFALFFLIVFLSRFEHKEIKCDHQWDEGKCRRCGETISEGGSDDDDYSDLAKCGFGIGTFADSNRSWRSKGRDK